MIDCIFAQMTRAPVPGEVKTRLLPVLSAQQAAELHRAMTESVYKTLRSVSDHARLWSTGSWNDFAGCADEVFQQRGDDLGERMGHVCQEALRETSRVVLVGSDCPLIDAPYLIRAAQLLAEVDVVFGPALDGGYVLLGLKQYTPELFSNIAWGQASVLEESIAAVRGLGWSYELLQPLSDVDTPEDLVHLPVSLRAALPPELLAGI